MRILSFLKNRHKQSCYNCVCLFTFRLKYDDGIYHDVNLISSHRPSEVNNAVKKETTAMHQTHQTLSSGP